MNDKNRPSFQVRVEVTKPVSYIVKGVRHPSSCSISIVSRKSPYSLADFKENMLV
jgi:hypothetical protein